MRAQNLSDLLEASANRYPNNVAVVDVSGQETTYVELARQVDALARFLAASGVRRGDRVGVVLPKGTAKVISLFAIMKAGAAYVPVDSTGPAERGRQILTDCEVSAIVVDRRALALLPNAETLRSIVVFGQSEGRADCGTTFEAALERSGPALSESAQSTDLAYILYTSGSTGTPKGVMITHANVISFLEWCSAAFEPTPQDRFANHAPFHFDASVFDIYLAAKHGASLHLISDAVAKAPEELARFIEARRVTFWLSAPSPLLLLTQFGNLRKYDGSSLRLVLFGGEVFPVKHLRDLQQHWPTSTFYNVYGPTETSVFCTVFRIPRDIPADREAPYPIGFPGPHCQVLVLNESGQPARSGEEGFLHIAGSPVFAGYWNRPVETKAVFIDREGVRWYNTGDVVRCDPTDGLVYIGRKDGMIKRRGYRIELGEIERALYLHPRVREAAVVSTPDTGQGPRIVAFVACEGTEPPSIIDFKTFCASRLPVYMSPDQFIFRRDLPRTSTDKMDYQKLRLELSEVKAG